MILDLSLKRIIAEADYYNSPINQLYHPTALFNIESKEIVYSWANLNLTKFIQILLKEWFYLVEKNGFLVIDYIPGKICDQQKLEEYMGFLWKGKYKIIYHNFIDESEFKRLDAEKIKEFIHKKVGNVKKNRYLRFICQKTTALKIPNDEITKWTFGIITNGKRDEWVRQIIASIRNQKIPQYEIIICGTFNKKLEKDIVYIPFNQKDDKGWITKKKNLIVEMAKFENICMLHDRIILKENWYAGMKKWGNCFENLGCKQLFEGWRVNDWIASHYFIRNKNNEKFSFESYVDYRDWYSSVWFLGQLNIFKKNLIVKNNLWWNENLFYGQREDFDFSYKLFQKGFIPRFNIFSEVETLTNKYVSPTFIRYSLTSFRPKMQFNNKNAYLKAITYLLLKILSFIGIKLSSGVLEKIRGKIYTFILMFTPSKYFHNREWRKVIE